MSIAVTRGVRVEVVAHFLPEHSRPVQGLWVHAYEVTITNESAVPVTLMTRHWIITNAHGTQEHVRGPGVVGEQPRLEPGESFSYRSGAPLDTPFGTMHGSYGMLAEDGSVFDAEVAPFDLAEPFAAN